MAKYREVEINFKGEQLTVYGHYEKCHVSSNYLDPSEDSSFEIRSISVDGFETDEYNEYLDEIEQEVISKIE